MAAGKVTQASNRGAGNPARGFCVTMSPEGTQTCLDAVAPWEREAAQAAVPSPAFSYLFSRPLRRWVPRPVCLAVTAQASLWRWTPRCEGSLGVLELCWRGWPEAV